MNKRCIPIVDHWNAHSFHAYSSHCDYRAFLLVGRGENVGREDAGQCFSTDVRSPDQAHDRYCGSVNVVVSASCKKKGCPSMQWRRPQFPKK